MTQTETMLSFSIPDDKSFDTLPVFQKLNSFKEALDKCNNEYHNPLLKEEFLWIYENLLKTITEGIKHGHKFSSCLICMDKAYAYCNLFNEYMFQIYDEVSEMTFDETHFALVRIKRELAIFLELYYAKMAF